MIADKVSSVQTTGNCLNLSLTKATTRTFVTNFHLVENLKQPPQTGQGIHIFFPIAHTLPSRQNNSEY